MNSTKTITIRPAAGNTGEIIGDSATVAIFTFENADFIIIDGRPGGVGNSPDMKIQNKRPGGAYCVNFREGAAYNILRFCNIIHKGVSEVVNIAGSSSTGNSNNSILNCKIEGGLRGIRIGSEPTGIINDSTVIRACEIFNFKSSGVFLFFRAKNTTVDSCLIYQTIASNTSSSEGIEIRDAIGSVNISNNRIYDLQSAFVNPVNDGAKGIWFAFASAEGSTCNIINNFISLTKDNPNIEKIYGIDITANTNALTVNCYYNTVRIGGTHTGDTAGTVISAGIRQLSQAVTLNAKNNLFINNRSGGNGIHSGGAYLVTPPALFVDYNCYFANGSGAFHSMWGPTGFNNLADYKAAASPNETNSIFKNVNFVSATDLHLAGASIGDTQLGGVPIPGITTDIDGQTRSLIVPYKGADEGPVSISIKQQSEIAETYSLSQNFPNPFNPVTNINFTIPKRGLVVLKVFDISGKEVVALINKELTAGAYNIDLDGTKLSSGVYFYTLKVNEFTDTKKMILIK